MKFQKNIQLTPKIASIIFPVIIGLTISFFLLIIGLLPVKDRVNKVALELKEYKKKSDTLSLILNNFKNQKLKLKNIYETKYNLINIIAGETDLKTLLAKINTLANDTNIKIEKIKPIRIVKFDQNKQNDFNSSSDNATQNQTDPLITPETFKEISTLEIIGDYESLISFLKRVEKMENIILINALSLKSSNSGSKDNVLQIRLDLGSYGRVNN